MTAPASLADAEDRRQQITLEIQGIQAQLGDKQRTDETGRRLNAQEYWAWKKRAQHALNQKLDELRSLKNWIKEHRPSEEAIRVPIDAQSAGLARHLVGLCEILTNLRNEEVDFDPEEINKIEAAQKMLDDLGIPRKASHAQEQSPAHSTGSG
jgi:hypothetical protein